MTKLTSIATSAVLLVGTYGFASAQQDRPESTATQEPSASSTVGNSQCEDILRSWPSKSRQVARDIIAKYGPPNEATQGALIWNENGPWFMTIVHRDEVAHNFPVPHSDIVEQFIPYRAPLDKYDELAQYDGSVVVQRTCGLMSARCDKEPMNFLALNLANDVATGQKTVEEARAFYAKTAMAFMNGEKPEYTQYLQFDVGSVEQTADPDRPANKQ